jgi:hypothetical protein
MWNERSRSQDRRVELAYEELYYKLIRDTGDSKGSTVLRIQCRNAVCRSHSQSLSLPARCLKGQMIKLLYVPYIAPCLNTLADSAQWNHAVAISSVRIFVVYSSRESDG